MPTPPFGFVDVTIHDVTNVPVTPRVHDRELDVMMRMMMAESGGWCHCWHQQYGILMA